MSNKKSLLTESEIARFKELAGIPLKSSERKTLSESKYGMETEAKKDEKKKKDMEELDEDLTSLLEADEEEEGGDDAEMDMGGEEAPEAGGDEELDLGDMGDEPAPEAPMGGSEGMDMGGESPEELIVGIVQMLQKLGKKVGVDIETDGELMGGADHSEPDADNMGGPSDMDADNMDDMDMGMGGEEEGEEEEGEEEEQEEEGEEEEEELEESAPVGFDPERRPNETPKDRMYGRGKLSESAIKMIAQRVAARLTGNKLTNRAAIVETVTKRVAARLIAEAKKGDVKGKMKAKKAKGTSAGHGPGSTKYGVKGEKVANKYELKDVKLPKNSGGTDTLVAKGGTKAKTIPHGAGKGSGKATKKNTTN